MKASYLFFIGFIPGLALFFLQILSSREGIHSSETNWLVVIPLIIVLTALWHLFFRFLDNRYEVIRK